MSDKMFLIFNRRTGVTSHLNADGTAYYVGGAIEVPYLLKALLNMHDGEYFHEGHFTISCSTGGITTDELLARNIKVKV